MSKFYLFLSAFLIVSAVNCQDSSPPPPKAAEPRTEQVRDKIYKNRVGTLMTLDDCFSLFIGKGQLFFNDGKSAYFESISVTEGHCAVEQKPDPGKQAPAHPDLVAEIKFDLKKANFVKEKLEIDLTIVINTVYKPLIEYWSISKITLIDPDQSKIVLVGDYLHAPLNFSYSCGNVILHRDPLTPIAAAEPDKDSFVGRFSKLVFKDFQIQPFKGDRFVDSYDCASWFSIGTFAGLLVLILFTFILAFGILYIMNIKTNDRFEDPKGKPLNLGNTDG